MNELQRAIHTGNASRFGETRNLVRGMQCHVIHAATPEEAKQRFIDQDYGPEWVIVPTEQDDDGRIIVVVRQKPAENPLQVLAKRKLQDRKAALAARRRGKK